MSLSDHLGRSRSSGLSTGQRANAFAPGNRSIADGMHPWDLARRIWQRRNVLLAALAVGMVVALAVLMVATPRYTAQSRILLESADTHFLDRDRGRESLFTDSQAIASQIQVLQSERLAGKVVATLDLERDPEFNESLKKPGLMAAIADAVKSMFPGRKPSAAERAEIQRTKILDKFQKSVTAYQLGASRVLAVEVTANQPLKAQRIADALADTYVQDQIEAKLEINRRGSDWLAGQIATLRKTVEQSERQVEAFREQSGLLKGTGPTLYAQNLSDLNSQVLAARTNRATLEARLSRITSLIKSDENFDSIGEVQQSPVIQKLKEQENALKGDIAEMSVKYLPTNPELIRAKASLDDLHATMLAEVGRIVAGLRGEVEIARNKQTSLTKQLDTLKNRAGEANTAEVRLRELEREAAADRALLESFLAMHKETVAQDTGGILAADARVIAQARLPLEPSFPRPAALFGLAAFVSLLIGFLIVAVLELRDRGFTNADALEEATGLSLLGMVPRVKPGVSCLWEPIPNGRYAAPPEFIEALRTVQTSLLVAGETEGVKSVVIASPGAREGKTTTTLNLARMLAAGGRKTVLIDADMRKPQIHQALGLREGPGLGDVLAGSAMLENVLTVDEPTGLAVMRAGKRVDNPATLLASKAMDTVLARLRHGFEFIIIDTSPIVEVADAQTLFAKADFSVLLVRWENTRQRAVLQALRLISAGGGQAGGILLSMADPSRVPHYGYGDYLVAEEAPVARPANNDSKPLSGGISRRMKRVRPKIVKPKAVKADQAEETAPPETEMQSELETTAEPETAGEPKTSPEAEVSPEPASSEAGSEGTTEEPAHRPRRSAPQMPAAELSRPSSSLSDHLADHTEDDVGAQAEIASNDDAPAENPEAAEESRLERIRRRSRLGLHDTPAE